MRLFSWKGLLLVSLTVGGGVILWWISDSLTTYVLVRRTGDTLTQFREWAILCELWPGMLLGMVPVTLIGCVGIVILMSRADNADIRARIARHEATTAQAIQKGIEAELNAQRGVQAQIDALQRQKQALSARETQLAQVIADAEQRVCQAEKLANEARQQTIDAERRRRNATATAERRRRKLERMKQTEQEEEPEFSDFFRS